MFSLWYWVDASSIIVVHGLAGYRPTSCIHGEDENTGLFWLEDVLQRDIPRVKIMSFWPRSDAAPENLFTARGLRVRAETLLNFICVEKDRENVRTSSDMTHRFPDCLTDMTLAEKAT